MVLESVIAFVIGLAVGLLLFALLLPLAGRRMRARHQVAIDRYEAELAELRQERADDRETNRRLRRELAINTPHSLEATREERDRAIEELDKLSSELRHTTMELAERDRSLREARLAIHDIRVQLEQDRFNRAADDNAVSALEVIAAGIDESSDQGAVRPVAIEPPAPPAPPAPPVPPSADLANGRQATLVPPSILNSAGEVDGSDDDLEQPVTFSAAPYDGSHEALEPALSESDVSSG
ncbi:MAG: hypothetical protein R2761_13205 [Acidimicrobiales bacterium]